MSKPNLAYLVLNSGTIVLNLNGKSHHINSDNRNYSEIREAINNHIAGKFLSTAKWEALCDVSKFITSYVGNSGVEFRNGQFFYCGQPLHNELVDTIEKIQVQGFNIDPMVKFLENLMQNSSKRATETVPSFINAKHMTITPDGCFLGYKSVNGDYLDWHSKKYSNKVGTVHEIPRNTVDENVELACSYGFHVGTYAYAYDFNKCTDQHIMLVKVNPKDVVSVPSDATEGKVRVCRYEVVGEMTDKEAPFEEAVTNTDGSKYTYNGPLDDDYEDEDDDDDLLDDESDYEDDSWEDSYEEEDYDEDEEEDSCDEDSCSDEGCEVCVPPQTATTLNTSNDVMSWPVDICQQRDFVHNGQNYSVGQWMGKCYLYRFDKANRFIGQYLSLSGGWDTYATNAWFNSYDILKATFNASQMDVKQGINRCVPSSHVVNTKENWKNQNRDSSGRFAQTKKTTVK